MIHPRFREFRAAGAPALAALAALALLSFVPVAASPVDASGTVTPLKPGDKAPAFSLPDPGGDAHSLTGSLEGAKFVIVDFWSTRCPFSRGYEARLRAIANDYASKGVKVVAIMSNQTETADDVKAYLAGTPVPYPVLIDAGSKTADLYGGQTTPHVFVVDASGKVRYAGGIDSDLKNEAGARPLLRNALDALLSGAEPAETVTRNFGCSIKRKA